MVNGPRVVSTRTRNFGGACASQNASSGWRSGLSAGVDGGVAGTTGCPGSIGTAVPVAHTSAEAFRVAGRDDFETVAHPTATMPATVAIKRGERIGRQCISLGSQATSERDDVGIR